MFNNTNAEKTHSNRHLSLEAGQLLECYVPASKEKREIFI